MSCSTRCRAGRTTAITRSRRRGLVTATRTGLAVLVAAGAAWAGLAWAARDETPSCSWPLRVRGTASAGQVGLVRCYLQALARRNIAGLYSVAQNIPPVRITSADLRYSADARTGMATAYFAPSYVSTSYAELKIRYADGTVETTGILNMVAMGGPSTWRMTIGSVSVPNTPEPRPVTT
jgi:hypothetical protein